MKYLFNTFFKLVFVLKSVTIKWTRQFHCRLIAFPVRNTRGQQMSLIKILKHDTFRRNTCTNVKKQNVAPVAKCFFDWLVFWCTLYKINHSRTTSIHILIETHGNTKRHIKWILDVITYSTCNKYHESILIHKHLHNLVWDYLNLKQKKSV